MATISQSRHFCFFFPFRARSGPQARKPSATPPLSPSPRLRFRRMLPLDLSEPQASIRERSLGRAGSWLHSHTYPVRYPLALLNIAAPSWTRRLGARSRILQSAFRCPRNTHHKNIESIAILA